MRELSNYTDFVLYLWLVGIVTKSRISTVKGDVFLWGSNKHGQLVSESLFLPLPVALDRSLLQGERVTDVHSGWTHLVAKTGESYYTLSHTNLSFWWWQLTIYYLFTESGRVFTWGRANYGQLGLTNQSTEKECDVSTSSGQSISRPIEVKALFGATQVCVMYINKCRKIKDTNI